VTPIFKVVPVFSPDGIAARKVIRARIRLIATVCIFSWKALPSTVVPATSTGTLRGMRSVRRRCTAASVRLLAHTDMEFAPGEGRGRGPSPHASANRPRRFESL